MSSAIAHILLNWRVRKLVQFLPNRFICDENERLSNSWVNRILYINAHPRFYSIEWRISNISRIAIIWPTLDYFSKEPWMKATGYINFQDWKNNERVKQLSALFAEENDCSWRYSHGCITMWEKNSLHRCHCAQHVLFESSCVFVCFVWRKSS